ncbi:MAG: polymer-forming cytoskeletal protein [Gammaproteobacteria bacterium]
MAKNLMSSVFGGGQSGKSAGAGDAVAEADVESSAAAPDSQSTANRLPVIILGKTLVFKGELSADEDVMLFGRVEGSIRHTGSLTVGAGGIVIGDIHAKAITIKGTVEGDLEATESVTISPTANVEGDIAAPRVCIVEGAQFNGAVEMTEAPVVEEKVVVPEAATGAVLSDKSVGQILGEK